MNGFTRRPSPAVRTFEQNSLPPVKVRVPSRFSGAKAGSGTSSPRIATPTFAARPARRRPKAFMVFQVALLVLVALLVTRQMEVFRNAVNAEPGGAATRKRQLIARATDLDRQHGISQSKDSQAHRLQSLTQTLLHEKTGQGVTMLPEESSVSEVVAHPTAGPAGDPTTFYYRFTNVRVGEGGVIEFYGGPTATPPLKASWYNVASGDNTKLQPRPTHLVFEDGEGSRRVIKVKYLAQKRPRSACKKSSESPTMLLHVPNSRDMWKVWTRSLIPTFQTLRELGYLPLMRVTPDNRVAAVPDGLDPKECPKVVDPATGHSNPAVDCSQLRQPAALPARCTGNDTWCLPGVWPHAAYVRSPQLPTMLYLNEAELDSEWGALFSSMAGGGVRPWDAEEGTCLRNLIVGTSRAVGVDRPLPSGGESGAPLLELERVAESLAVFSMFARAALRRLAMNNAIDFEGYPLRPAQRLREGIAHGNGRKIDVVFNPQNFRKERTDPLYEDWQELKDHSWMFGITRKTKLSREAKFMAIAEAAEAAQSSPLGPPKDYELQSPRPVVTYISRLGNLTGAVLNDRQVLRYIFWRYNITLRVTTLNEHAEAASKLLLSSDVVIGPQGPHWANAVFLKKGAVTLQMLPYGWRLEDGGLLRGGEVERLVHLRRGTHINWVNPVREYSFFRMADFEESPDEIRQHPEGRDSGSEWAAPDEDSPHPAWLNANTYADLYHLGPFIDQAMEAAGIPKISGDTNAERLQKQLQNLKERDAVVDFGAKEDEGSSSVTAAGLDDEEGLEGEDDEEMQQQVEELEVEMEEEAEADEDYEDEEKNNEGEDYDYIEQVDPELAEE